MDEIFHLSDETLTSAGQAVQYRWLRRPCADEASLEARRGLVRYFLERPALAEAFRKRLAKVGRQGKGDAASEIWGQAGDAYLKYKGAYISWMIFMALSIALSFLSGFYPLIVVLAFSIANLVVFTKTTAYVGSHYQSIAYIAALLWGIDGLSRIPMDPSGRLEIDGLKSLAGAARKIPRELRLLRNQGPITGDLAGLIVDYFRIFLLGELGAYFRFYSAFRKRLKDIARVYETVGAIDAAAGLALAMSRDANLVFSDVSTSGGVRASGMVHPLVGNCVPADCSLERGIVITGTNMSGKTTFLRALGINQALACAYGIAYARAFSTSFYGVMSAIRVQDDVREGKSRYLAEAERLLNLVERCESAPTLALVDEILSGTNSADRISASVRILRHLAGTNSIVAAATHDLEIAQALGESHDAFFFSERIEGGDLRFDYLLKPGIVDRRNALKILEHLGFSRFLGGPEKDPPGVSKQV